MGTVPVVAMDPALELVAAHVGVRMNFGVSRKISLKDDAQNPSLVSYRVKTV